MTKKKLESKVLQLKELKAQQTELQKEIDTIESEIKMEMVKQKKQELKVGIYTVRYKELVKRVFNAEMFKSTNSGLYDKFVCMKPYKRLTIS